MAYPLIAAVNAAIVDVELCFTEDFTVEGSRNAVEEWRSVVAFLETATGYSLTKRDFSASDDLYGSNTSEA